MADAFADDDDRLSMTPDSSRTGPPRWPRRVAWLLAIWAGSVGALALVAVALKAVMRLVGLG